MSDLTKERQAVELLKSSQSAREWDASVDKIRRANGGYPRWWYKAVILPGIEGRQISKWSEESKVQIKTT